LSRWMDLADNLRGTWQSNLVYGMRTPPTPDISNHSMCGLARLGISTGKDDEKSDGSTPKT